MLIGELSNKTGLTRDTIRFYEKHGLIEVGKKERRFNNYKEYSEQILQRLMTIKRIKGLGFTLNEASELLEMIELNEATCDNVAYKIEDKVKMLDEKIRELLEIRTSLLDGMKKCKEGSCDSLQPADNCQMIVS